MKLIASFVMILTPLVAAQFYVKDQQYRFPAGTPSCDTNRFCDFEEHTSGDQFSINFVEFRGDGKPFDPGQLTRALDQIRKAAYIDPKTGETQHPVVFVYIHGWHNNADEVENPATRICPDLKGDVAKFRDCGLRKIAQDHPTIPGAPPSVVGIYLAWQGTDFTPLGLVTYIVPSYTLRRYAATHVGQTGMRDALCQILDTVAEKRDRYTVFVMGHSFGARVLENADPLEQHRKMLKEVAKKDSSDLDARDIVVANSPPPADLFFYANAAAPNTFTRKRIKDWNTICTAPKTKDNPVCSANPFYVSVTSRTDVGTGLVMFVANIAFFWWPTGLNPPQFELTPFSAGNSFWMHTHHDPKNIKTKVCPAGLSPNGRCFQVPRATHGPNIYSDTFEVEPIVNEKHRFWIMNIGHYLVRNHGDVWNDKIFAMANKLLNDHPKYSAGNEHNKAVIRNRLGR